MSSGARVAAAEHSSHASRAAANPLQAKLSVGRSNDGFEQEADRVSDAVVSRNSAAPVGPSLGLTAVAGRVAPKISRLKDQSARRAPRAKLQRQEDEEPQATLQRQEDEEPQAKLQRQEDEEPQAKLQRQEQEEPQARLEPRANVRDKRMYPKLARVEGKLFESKGKGEALDDETRIAMETGFGADFSGVRIHTGGDAVAMSRDLKAQAFTHGNDVFFNSGKYEPETARGRSLLAHELTHVVQQGATEQNMSEARVEATTRRATSSRPSRSIGTPSRLRARPSSASDETSRSSARRRPKPPRPRPPRAPRAKHPVRTPPQAHPRARRPQKAKKAGRPKQKRPARPRVKRPTKRRRRQHRAPQAGQRSRRRRPPTRRKAAPSAPSCTRSPSRSSNPRSVASASWRPPRSRRRRPTPSSPKPRRQSFLLRKNRSRAPRQARSHRSSRPRSRSPTSSGPRSASNQRSRRRSRPPSRRSTSSKRRAKAES